MRFNSSYFGRGEGGREGFYFVWCVSANCSKEITMFKFLNLDLSSSWTNPGQPVTIPLHYYMHPKESWDYNIQNHTIILFIIHLLYMRKCTPYYTLLYYSNSLYLKHCIHLYFKTYTVIQGRLKWRATWFTWRYSKTFCLSSRGLLHFCQTGRESQLFNFCGVVQGDGYHSGLLVLWAL